MRETVADGGKCQCAIRPRKHAGYHALPAPLLDYIKPDKVTLLAGTDFIRRVERGTGAALEQEGYERVLGEAA